jgi:serine/threonine protein kinase
MPEARCGRCQRVFPASDRFCPYDGAALASDVAWDAADPLVNLVVADRYRLMERIGEGGMGAVYRAVHVLLDRPVALKILREDLPSQSNAARRFHQEARAASRVNHENVVTILDFGRAEQGFLYLVMELVDGEPLSSVIARSAPLHASRVVDVAMQIASALEQASELGIVHRDLKPDNVLLTRRRGRGDFVKLLDFGLAKLLSAQDAAGPITMAGAVFGTPEYMSPEQWRGTEVDVRSDIYSLGIVLYECLTGALPWTGTYAALFRAHLTRPPPSIRDTFPDIRCPPRLEAIVLKCLEKEPDKRYASATDLRGALDACGITIPPSKSSLRRRARADISLDRTMNVSGSHGQVLARVAPAQPAPAATVRALAIDLSQGGVESLQEDVVQLERRREEALLEIAEALFESGVETDALGDLLVRIREEEQDVLDRGADIALCEAELEESDRRAREAASDARLELIDLNLGLDALRDEAHRLDEDLERLRGAAGELEQRLLTETDPGRPLEARDSVREAVVSAETHASSKGAEVLRADLSAKARAKELGQRLRRMEEDVARLEGTLRAKTLMVREREASLAADYLEVARIVYALDPEARDTVATLYAALVDLDARITDRQAALALRAQETAVGG